MARPPWIATAGPHVLFDRHAVSGRSQELENPTMSTLVIEVFPAEAGASCDLTVVDAGPFGVLAPCADPAGSCMAVTAYRKCLVRNVLPRVAIDLTVHSGSWSVWVTAIPFGSTIPTA